MTASPSDIAHCSTAAARQAAWVALCLGLAAIALRLPWLPAVLENHDSVNFALGLESYDLSLARPHFPGYPVFLALAWLATQLGLSAPMALALPGVLLSGAAAAALLLALRPTTGLAVAALAAGCYGLAPGVLVTDLKALSDGLGVHLFTLCLAGALAAARRPALRAWVAAGLGVLLGVRAASLALAAPLALWLLWEAPTRRARAAIVVAGLAATAAWLVPLAVLSGGPGRLADLGGAFLSGHFGDWGAGYSVAPSLGARAAAVGWNLGAFALGWGALALGLAAWGLSSPAPDRRAARLALAVGVPYLAWIWLAQHPDSARHALPLVPLLLVGLAPAATGTPRRAPRLAALAPRLATWTSRLALRLVALALPPALRLATRTPMPAPRLAPRAPALAARLAALALPLALLLDSGARLATQVTTLPPSIQAAQWLAHHRQPAQLQLYSGPETAVVRTYAPGFRATLVRSGADVSRDLDARGSQPRAVLLTSRVPRRGDDGLTLTPLARFARDPLVGPRESELTLYAVATPDPSERP